MRIYDEDTINVALPGLGQTAATRNRIGIHRRFDIETWAKPLEDFVKELEEQGQDLSNPHITVEHERSYSEYDSCDFSVYIEGWMTPDATQQAKIDAAWIKEDARREREAATRKKDEAKRKAAAEARERKEFARLKKKYDK